jgi:hypothetical protein
VVIKLEEEKIHLDGNAVEGDDCKIYNKDEELMVYYYILFDCRRAWSRSGGRRRRRLPRCASCRRRCSYLVCLLHPAESLSSGTYMSLSSRSLFS